MKQFIVSNKNALMGCAALLLIGVVTLSFQDSPVVHQKFAGQEMTDDTVPDKNRENSMKMKDFDRLVDDFDKTVLDVSKEIGKVDFKAISENLEKALKQIDMKKIMQDVDHSLAAVDIDKILDQVKSSLKDIRWDDAKGELNETMEKARVEIEKARKEIQHIDKNEIEKAMQDARRELEKAKIDLKDIDVDKIMSEAREGIAGAKEELKQTRAMINEMEKDGLISRKDGFRIEYKDKELFINGKQQPASVTEKYRPYFKKDHFTINIDKDE